LQFRVTKPLQSVLAKFINAVLQVIELFIQVGEPKETCLSFFNLAVIKAKQIQWDLMLNQLKWALGFKLVHPLLP